MVLYNYAMERWVKPIAEKRRAENLERGRAEGRAEANRQWQAWLQRKTEADSSGLPFDEPPPSAVE